MPFSLSLLLLFLTTWFFFPFGLIILSCSRSCSCCLSSLFVLPLLPLLPNQTGMETKKKIKIPPAKKQTEREKENERRLWM
uniref:Uncharacterized protein n=1 Tax=Rhizophora mucronata TaxID=61149 RepID=A0A2P2MZ83_RHIMU